MNDGPKLENYHANMRGLVAWCLDYCGWYMLEGHIVGKTSALVQYLICDKILKHVLSTDNRDEQITLLDRMTEDQLADIDELASIDRDTGH